MQLTMKAACGLINCFVAGKSVGFPPRRHLDLIERPWFINSLAAWKVSRCKGGRLSPSCLNGPKPLSQKPLCRQLQTNRCCVMSAFMDVEFACVLGTTKIQLNVTSGIYINSPFQTSGNWTDISHLWLIWGPKKTSREREGRGAVKPTSNSQSQNLVISACVTNGI